MHLFGKSICYLQLLFPNKQKMTNLLFAQAPIELLYGVFVFYLRLAVASADIAPLNRPEKGHLVRMIVRSGDLCQ